MSIQLQPCEQLLKEAHLEIFELVGDNCPATIHLHPGVNGQSSYLYWKPANSDGEIQIWEFDPHSEPKSAVRNISIMGDAAKSLLRFMATEIDPDHGQCGIGMQE